MVSFGAIRVDEKLETTFFGQCAPISSVWQDAALAISKITRKTHLTYPPPVLAITNFDNWVAETSGGQQPVFITDNLAFDWMWMNYYLHRFSGRNVFGWSGRRIGDIYAGMHKDMRAGWKHLRRARHDHNPVNDALGNAEALLRMAEMGVRGIL